MCSAIRRVIVNDHAVQLGSAIREHDVGIRH